MSFLLDSDWLIDYLDGDPEARNLITNLLPNRIAISAVTYMEVYDGIETRAAGPVNDRVFRLFLHGVDVLPFDRRVARHAATLRAGLRARGRPVRARALDIQIAATALTHGLTLVTRNRDDYDDIPDLALL